MLYWLLSLPIWAYVSYSDFQSRTAPNVAWVLLLFLAISRAVFTPTESAHVVAGVVVLYPVLWYIYRTQDIGGADIKALGVLPLLYPPLVVSILILTALASLPWILLKGQEYAVPFLIPLSVGVFCAVAYAGVA